MRTASLKVGTRQEAAIEPQAGTPQAESEPKKKAGDNKAKAPAPKVTKPVRTARVDPLAPLPEGAGTSATTRESGPNR